MKTTLSVTILLAVSTLVTDARKLKNETDTLNSQLTNVIETISPLAHTLSMNSNGKESSIMQALKLKTPVVTRPKRTAGLLLGDTMLFRQGGAALRDLLINNVRNGVNNENRIINFGGLLQNAAERRVEVGSNVNGRLNGINIQDFSRIVQNENLNLGQGVKIIHGNKISGKMQSTTTKKKSSTTPSSTTLTTTITTTLPPTTSTTTLSPTTTITTTLPPTTSTTTAPPTTTTPPPTTSTTTPPPTTSTTTPPPTTTTTTPPPTTTTSTTTPPPTTTATTPPPSTTTISPPMTTLAPTTTTSTATTNSTTASNSTAV